MHHQPKGSNQVLNHKSKENQEMSMTSGLIIITIVIIIVIIIIITIIITIIIIVITIVIPLAGCRSGRPTGGFFWRACPVKEAGHPTPSPGPGATYRIPVRIQGGTHQTMVDSADQSSLVIGQGPAVQRERGTLTVTWGDLQAGSRPPCPGTGRMWPGCGSGSDCQLVKQPAGGASEEDFEVHDPYIY